MTPGSVVKLTNKITIKNDGLIAEYKLNKEAYVRALILPNVMSGKQELAVKAAVNAILNG